MKRQDIEAVTHLQRILQNYPADIKLLDNMAEAVDSDPGNKELRDEYSRLGKRMQRIDEALDSITSADRKLVELHFFKGYSFNQLSFKYHYSPRGLHERVRMILLRLTRTQSPLW